VLLLKYGPQVAETDFLSCWEVITDIKIVKITGILTPKLQES